MTDIWLYCPFCGVSSPGWLVKRKCKAVCRYCGGYVSDCSD